MRAKEWLNAADFDKGLAVARTRYPQSSGAVQPVLPEAIAPPLPAAKPEVPVAIEPAKQQSPDLQMKIEGGARFARPWRVWMKKT